MSHPALLVARRWGRRARHPARLPSAVHFQLRKWWAGWCFRLESRRRDVFLASYPRSGRHWVGFFLSTLIHPRIPDGPDSIDFHNWERVLPNIDRMIPEHMLRIRRYRHRPDPRVFLSHHQSDPRLRRAVYLVRDPRDVLVSHFYEHQRRFPDRIRDLRAFVEASLAGRLWPGVWGEHVDGWRARVASGEVLLVRYEDLHARPFDSFGSIARFIGLEISDHELAAAMKSSSFDVMQEVEKTRGAPGTGGDPNVPLVRRGRVGSWVEDLEPSLARRVEQAYGDSMAALGYVPGVAATGTGLG